MKSDNQSCIINPQTCAQITVPFFIRLIDRFRDYERIKIEWTSSDFKRISILWGFYKFESGERKTFIIEGPPGFCSAALREIRNKALNTGGEVKLLEEVE